MAGNKGTIVSRSTLAEVVQEHEMIYQAIERKEGETARIKTYEHIMFQKGQSNRCL